MNHSVIVAGLGRCGTTLLYESLKPHYNYNDIFIVDLDRSIDVENKLFKTHDFAPKIIYNKCKFIFMYGNPINTVLSFISLIKNNFSDLNLVAKHFHFNASDLLYWENKDVFRLEENFDSWYKSQNFSLLTIKYEKLYENLDIIMKYLNINFSLPEKKQRQTDWINYSNKDLLNKTYKSIVYKIEKSEDIKIW
jgi:hypothetical protein